MSLETLTEFFKWCTIINGGLYILWVAFLTLMPDLTYRLQSAFVPLPRETYNVVIYSFLGLFKIIFLVFNVVPWVALSMIG